MLSRDIDLNFRLNPLTGDVSVKTNDDAVKQALKNLILLNIFEKPFNNDLGPNIRNYLFENYLLNSNKFLEDKIKSIIQRYETRVTLKDVRVQVDENNNSINVNIEYFITGSKQQELSLILERTR